MGDQQVSVSKAAFDKLVAEIEEVKKANAKLARQQQPTQEVVFTKPSNVTSKIIMKRFDENQILHEKLQMVERGLEELAPKTESGEIDMDNVSPDVKQSLMAMAELIRHTQLVYSSILAAGKVEQGEQLAVMESYYEWMQPHIDTPHQDYMSGKKRLTDVQNKEYRAAVQDVKDRAKEKEKERDTAKKSGQQQWQGGRQGGQFRWLRRAAAAAAAAGPLAAAAAAAVPAGSEAVTLREPLGRID